MIFYAINFILCSGVLYTCFCRLVKTDLGTHYSIRHAFALLGTVAFASAVSFIWDQPVTLFQLLITAAFLIVQVTCGKIWWKGVPDLFRTMPSPHDRRSDDRHDAAVSTSQRPAGPAA